MLLKQPGRLGPYRLKNRVVMAPMGTNYSTTDGFSSERDKRYYEERAIGGVSMIMTEAMPVSPGAKNHRNSLHIYHDRFIPGLATLVEAIKRHDCYVFGQLSHRGGLLKRSVLNMEPVGPSPWRNPNTGEEVREMSVREIREVQKDFVAAARRLKQAGYDGCELHGANGYLLHQFFTARVNRRTDQYGGSLENRMRMLLETVARVRDALDDFPVMVRLSVTEYVDGGYTMDEVIALAQALEKAGVVALDLSGGTNESPELSRFCIQPPSMPRRCLEPYARPIKAAVSIPVLIAGRIITPEDAEAVLAAGSADFISLGRALYADPHWCRKAFGELKAPIRECISCNVCFERLTLELDVSCVQNPMVGTEFESVAFAEPHLAKGRAVGSHKRILVLGAGVAGVEAARVAAAQGHEVEIWESAPQPGGQIHLAVAAPDKTEVWPAWTYRMRELESLGVAIRVGMLADEDAIRRFAPDLVVVATGAKHRVGVVDLRGLESEVPQLQAWDVLRDGSLIPPRARVTIVGGGMVGIEVADKLVASGCTATIVEMQPVIAKAMARNNKTDVLLRLKAGGVRIMTSTTILGAAGRRLLLKTPAGEEALDVGDAVILAVGPQPERSVLPMLERAGVDYVLAGDCLEPGDFMSAIRDGWMVGLSLRTRFGHGESASTRK